MTDQLTQDDFLGGRLRLAQPKKGYRAGVDPVLLAASVQAQGGETVLELGCGTGAALLCLGTRVPGLTLTGIEVQHAYAEIARDNAKANNIPTRIITADLRSLPADIRNNIFDHVIANPPYFDRAQGTSSTQADRDMAFGGDTDMADWIDVATRRLRPNGYLTMIQKTPRLPELLRAIDGRLGGIIVRPIAARVGREADRFLLQARKGGRAAFRLAAPLVLHDKPIHERDGEDYRPEIRDALRNAAPLAAFD